MRLQRNWIIVLVVFCGLSDAAHARCADVQVGDRIRIMAPDITNRMAPAALRTVKISPFVSEIFLIGRVARIDGKTMTVWADGADSVLEVSTQDIIRIDVWSPGTHKTSGTFLGLLGGAFIGGVIGNSVEEKREPEPPGTYSNCNTFICPIDLDLDLDLDLEPSATVMGVILGGAIGAVIGGVIGSGLDRDGWDQTKVHPGRLRITAEKRGEVGISCSVFF